MPSRHGQAYAAEVLESRMLMSAQGAYLEQLIQGAAASLRAGYTPEKARTLELLNTLSTRSTSTVYSTQGERKNPANGVFPQLIESTPLIHLNNFRSDAQFAGINGAGFSTVIIDTGIDLNHPFFGPDTNSDGIADRIMYSYDFSGANDSNASDFDGHGSNVASIAASSDGTYTGMAPGAGIIALKVFPDGGGGAFDSDIQEALQWVIANAATYNIASVNLSLGSGNFGYTGFSSSYADEFAALASLNVIVAVASGNGYGGSLGVASPANSYDVISVGAVYDSNIGGVSYGGGTTAFTTAADVITPFTQRHASLLDIFAPGAAITGANATGGLATYHGTSQAAPHIAGIAVLAQQLAVQQLGRRLSTDEFRALLQSSGVVVVDGDDENDNVPNSGLSFRRVDVLALGNAILSLRPSSISGSIYEDSNGNGTNNSEPPLSGWSAYLDDNNNGSRDVLTSTASSGDVPKSVPDRSMTRSVLSLSGRAGPITDVNVTLTLSHNSTSQLGVYLLSPWGERVELFAGLAGNGFSSTTLDDEAGLAITSGSAPFSGSYRPQASLSVLDGYSANGAWYLELHDSTNGISGTLSSWSLTIGTAERSSISDGSGNYSFTGLRGGNYTVREMVQPGWTLTQPAAGFYSVSLVPNNSASGYLFGNMPLDSIAPTVLSWIINDGSAQRSRILDVSVHFSEPVTITSAFTLGNLRSGSPIAGVSISWTPDPVDATLYKLTFAGVATEFGSLPDGLFRLTVLAAGIADLSGNAMAANYSLISFHRLFGDFDGDRDVDRTDQTLFKAALNRPANYAWYMDYNGDSVIDNTDLQQLKSRENRIVL